MEQVRRDTMLRDDVLMILCTHEGYFSGAEISRRLGVTRMAVSNAVRALRDDGYEIDAVTNRGYCLRGTPGRLTQGEVCAFLPEQRRALVRCFDSIDSTNSYLKREAMQGAPHGLCAVANEQTAGRGRSGRDFRSAADCGIYLSLLLRPRCAPMEAATLTSHAAVAVCQAIDRVCGCETGIKWTNDILLNERKICGTLTELTLEGETAALDSVVIGIGVNVNNRMMDFPLELREKAGSIFSETGQTVNRAKLTAAMIEALDAMYAAWEHDRFAYLQQYRDRCLTVGREVRVLRGDHVRDALAQSVAEDFGLRVRYADGTEETLNAGEVTVRGKNGYI